MVTFIVRAETNVMSFKVVDDYKIVYVVREEGSRSLFGVDLVSRLRITTYVHWSCYDSDR